MSDLNTSDPASPPIFWNIDSSTLTAWSSQIVLFDEIVTKSLDKLDMSQWLPASYSNSK